MDEIARAVADHDGLNVNWLVHTPLRMTDDLTPLCNEVDKYLLDHPKQRVTIVIER